MQKRECTTLIRVISVNRLFFMSFYSEIILELPSWTAQAEELDTSAVMMARGDSDRYRDPQTEPSVQGLHVMPVNW